MSFYLAPLHRKSGHMLTKGAVGRLHGRQSSSLPLSWPSSEQRKKRASKPYENQTNGLKLLILWLQSRATHTFFGVGWWEPPFFAIKEITPSQSPALPSSLYVTQGRPQKSLRTRTYFGSNYAPEKIALVLSYDVLGCVWQTACGVHLWAVTTASVHSLQHYVRVSKKTFLC